MQQQQQQQQKEEQLFCKEEEKPSFVLTRFFQDRRGGILPIIYGERFFELLLMTLSSFPPSR